MPSETRLLIYGFVVGVGLRILINIDMEGVFDVQVVYFSDAIVETNALTVTEL